MVSSSCTCIIRLPSPWNSTTVPSGRAAATPMANEMPLPIAPNSRMVRNFSCGREGICAKNHEQWPPEFTISQSRGKAFLRLDHVARVEQPRLDLECVAVGLRIADARSHRIASPASVAARQRRCQRFDSQARVGPQVMTRHLLALTDRDGVDIDLQHPRLRP